MVVHKQHNPAHFTPNRVPPEIVVLVLDDFRFARDAEFAPVKWAYSRIDVKPPQAHFAEAGRIICIFYEEKLFHIAVEKLNRTLHGLAEIV